VILKPRHSDKGFTNQQAVLLLFALIPIALITIGTVTSFINKSTEQVAIESNSNDNNIEIRSAPKTTVQTYEYEQRIPGNPVANLISSRVEEPNSCWFQMERGGMLEGKVCDITARINVNGHKVFDVIEETGIKRSIVLWTNKEAEVFLQGTRYTGRWIIDKDGDVRVTVGGGTFAFTPAS